VCASRMDRVQDGSDCPGKLVARLATERPTAYVLVANTLTELRRRCRAAWGKAALRRSQTNTVSEPTRSSFAATARQAGRWALSVRRESGSGPGRHHVRQFERRPHSSGNRRRRGSRARPPDDRAAGRHRHRPLTMRALRLARIAAQAEGLVLRRHFRRVIVQAILGGVAAIFLICALALAHFAGWLALVRVVAPVWAALIVFGVDMVLGAILGLLAMRSTPDRIEREAIQVRDQAKQQLAIAAATASTFAPIARLLGLRHVSGLVIGALATRYLTPRR
jgi:hypothetical protein